MHAVSEPELLVWSARSTYVNSFISMNPYIYIAEYTCNRSRRERERRMAQDLHGCMDRVQELAHACSTGRASRERARPPRPSATASAACQEHRSYTCMPTATARLAAACARERTAGRGAVPAVRALPQPTTRRTQPQSARATTDAREPAGELAGAGGTLLNCRLQPADVRRRSRRLAWPGRGPRPRAACSVLHVNAAVQCRRPWPVGRALVTQVTRRPADACVVSIRSPSLPRARSLSPRTSGLGVPG